MSEKKKLVWICGEDECVAYTKSEARAIFKKRRGLKRLPPGEIVEKVAVKA